MYLKVLLRSLILLPVLGSVTSHATHIVGGEMFYDHLGGDQYQITVKLYRDCTGIAFDDPINVGIYSGAGNFIQFVSIAFPGGTFVPVELDSPCLTLPPNICVQTASYITVVNLPPTADGYILSYQRCCRTGIIINLPNPGNLGLTVLTRIPGQANALNSSARFNELPPIALCLNEPLVFDHSATDPDGDQLIYELCTPFNGGTSTDPNPVPSTATQPPYTFVPWGAGYSEGYPIDSDPAIAIDPNTGLLTLTPTQLGNFVVGVCVSEYRNGELLGITRRDFLFNVVACDASVVSAIFPQGQFCTGLTATFGNNSNGAQSYSWDFGDPTTDQDVSTSSTPSWTYSAPGDYTVTLIANPGTVCADTAVQVFQMYDNPEPFFTTPDTLCGPSEISFLAEGSYYPTASVNWNFGSGAAPSTAQGVEASASFGTEGSQMVTLSITQNGCTGLYSAPVFVYPQPEAFFVADPLSPQLAGTVVDLFDQSQANGGTLVNWEWMANGVPIGAGPNVVWDNTLPGEYSISLTVTTAFGCTDEYILYYLIIPGEVIIPNVFSPNGDGSNDFFVIENAQYWVNTLTIFNRWGMPIYETNNYKNNWRGLDVPDGTYYYVFTLNDGREFTGHVTILR